LVLILILAIYKSPNPTYLNHNFFPDMKMVFSGITDFSGLLGLPLWLIVVASIWTIIWKGFALWKSARKNSMVWFIVLLVVNTLGILEILYIFLFSEMKFDDKPKQRPKRKIRKTKQK